MADWMNEASTSGDQEDALGLLFGGNVKLDPVKLYAFGTWFKGGDMIMPLPGLSVPSRASTTSAGTPSPWACALRSFRANSTFTPCA